MRGKKNRVIWRAKRSIETNVESERGKNESERRQIIVDIHKSQRVCECLWYVWPLLWSSLRSSACFLLSQQLGHANKEVRGKERERERSRCTNMRRISAKCDLMRPQSYHLAFTFILIKIIMQTATGTAYEMHSAWSATWSEFENVQTVNQSAERTPIQQWISTTHTDISLTDAILNFM